ncbi:MAG: glycoside hydrolase family 20 zincin-like fold domain-containing protein [Planctomycetota bacterium]|jgi:hypothetical protein
MRILTITVLCVALFNMEILGALPQPTAISKEEALAWVRHTVPLPKQIEITGKMVIPVSQVVIKTGKLSAPLVAQAVKELQERLNKTPSKSSAALERFTVTFQLGGPKTLSLKGLKNSDQAYRIIADKKDHGLELISLTPRGLYYAAKTLQQLIKAKLADGKVEMPLMTVTDWPDMAARGVWGVDASSKVRWLSDRKFNYIEQIASSIIDEQRKPVATLASFKQQMVRDGPQYGVSPVPAIVHLEQISHGGLFKHYPEVKGKGEGIHEGAICYANPLFTDILAKWMIGYLSMTGVNEVDVWMAENLRQKAGCQCDACKNENRDLMELNVILAAWEKAKERMPNARLWILTSEETYDSNEQILKALSPDVRFWYYHSLLTYNTSQTPMVPGYLAKSAAEGREVGVCLNLSPHSTNYQPMTGVQFIHYRMTEFVNKGIPAFLGYPTPGVVFFRFNTEAAGEWSWNAGGRSPREFAYSWAVRTGWDDPELFAEWAIVNGEVAWDVYGSEWPAGEQRAATGNVAKQLKEGKLPEMGYVLWGIYPKPWGDIKTFQQLNRDTELADRAVEMAQRFNKASLLHESITVQGYIQSLKALYELKQIVTPEGVADDNRTSAQRYFQMYIDALKQARYHLVEWEVSLSEIHESKYVEKVCKLLDRMIQDMVRVASELGFTVKMS